MTRYKSFGNMAGLPPQPPPFMPPQMSQQMNEPYSNARAYTQIDDIPMIQQNPQPRQRAIRNAPRRELPEFSDEIPYSNQGMNGMNQGMNQNGRKSWQMRGNASSNADLIRNQRFNESGVPMGQQVMMDGVEGRQGINQGMMDYADENELADFDISCQDIARHIARCRRCSKMFKRKNSQSIWLIVLIVICVFLLTRLMDK